MLHSDEGDFDPESLSSDEGDSGSDSDTYSYVSILFFERIALSNML